MIDSTALKGDELVIQRLTELEALESVREEWAILCKECPTATPFQHPNWVIPWARHFVEGGIFTLALRSPTGCLIGLAPWFRYVRNGERVLTSLGGGLSDHHEILAHPAWSSEVTRAVWEALAEATHAWDVCELEQLSECSPLLSEPLPARLVEERRGESEPCPVLRFPTSGPKLAVVPGHQLAQFRKYRRRAERLGELSLLRANLCNCQEMLTTFFELHSARWRSRNGTGMAADPVVQAFHREVAQGFARDGDLRLYALTSEQKTLASLYGFYGNRTLYCYWQGFDPEAAALSPGMQVVGSVIEAAANEGAMAVDFLRGSEPYKFRWGAVNERTYRLRLIPHHP